jgi:hypothetical protein
MIEALYEFYKLLTYLPKSGLEICIHYKKIFSKNIKNMDVDNLISWDIDYIVL